MVQCTIDGGEEGKDWEIQEKGRQALLARLERYKINMKARVWSVTYELHHIDFILDSLSQSKMVIG